MFLGKGVLKISSKFTGEHPCRSAISIKLLCNFIETTLRHGCSPVNLPHIFRTPFAKNISGELLLSLLNFDKNKQKLDISDKCFNDCEWVASGINSFMMEVSIKSMDWLLIKSMDWFLYDRDLRYERVKTIHSISPGLLRFVSVRKRKPR